MTGGERQAALGRVVRSACETGAALALLAGASVACGLVYEALALAVLGLVPAGVAVSATREYERERRRTGGRS